MQPSRSAFGLAIDRRRAHVDKLGYAVRHRAVEEQLCPRNREFLVEPAVSAVDNDVNAPDCLVQGVGVFHIAGRNFNRQLKEAPLLLAPRDAGTNVNAVDTA